MGGITAVDVVCQPQGNEKASSLCDPRSDAFWLDCGVHKSKNMEIVLEKEVGADTGFAEEAMSRL